MRSKPSKTRSRQSPALAGKIALVTGANRGLGFAIANALAEKGCELAITGRDEKQLQRASRELSAIAHRVRAYRCDVRDRDSVQAVMAATKKEFGRIDILV